MTQFEDERGTTWGWSVIAGTEESAALIADARGLGEKVTVQVAEFHD